MTDEIGQSLNKHRVLVTGAPGFIGSHLTRRLVRLGAEVFVTTQYKSVINNVRLADIWNDITVIEADLRHLDGLLQIREIRPQIVFHLAAYNHVGDSFISPSESLESNAVGTTNLLTAFDQFERFIYVSSSEVYGDRNDVPFTESQTPAPASPYSIGKYAGELYARMFSEDRNYPISVIRPFNAYGPYQSERALIAETIITCLQDLPMNCTAGHQTREFNYVGNLVDGMLLAAASDDLHLGPYNLGGEEEISVRSVIEKIRQVTGSSSEIRFGALPERPTEIHAMRSDSSLIRETLGWTPRLDFDAGLNLTVDWYRSYLEVFLNKKQGLSALADAAYSD